MFDVAIIDYNNSNLFSVNAACKKIGLNSIVTNDKEIIINPWNDEWQNRYYQELLYLNRSPNNLKTIFEENQLKIALGFKILDGSWGGGNQFVNYLYQDAKKRGYQLTTSLEENDIDIILKLYKSILYVDLCDYYYYQTSNNYIYIFGL